MSFDPVILAAASSVAFPWRPWLGIALILAGARALLAAVNGFQRRFRPAPETCRKALHVGMGTLFLACPWLFDRPWPVFVLAGIFCALLAARRYLPQLQGHVAEIIDGVGRQSLGEYYFPLAAAALFAGARGDPLLYAVPLALLVYADAAAATVGGRYGSIRIIGRKSVEGSVAFALTAFFLTHVPLLLTARAAPIKSLVVAAVIAVTAAFIEVVCTNGIDNVAVPLFCFCALRMMPI